MKRIIFLLLFCLPAALYAQDSTAAIYINSLVSRIESRLPQYIKEVKDTIIYENEETRNMKEALMLHTVYYTNKATGEVEKIIERSRYQKWTTELIVYYQQNKPIRFSSTKWESEKLKVDFDIYYMNNHSVHMVKRDLDNRKPDSSVFLKWCYELLTSR